MFKDESWSHKTTKPLKTTQSLLLLLSQLLYHLLKYNIKYVSFIHVDH